MFCNLPQNQQKEFNHVTAIFASQSPWWLYSMPQQHMAVGSNTHQQAAILSNIQHWAATHGMVCYFNFPRRVVAVVPRRGRRGDDLCDQVF
jgi:cation diffusion facilitator CzcD-associated flavoprotein CzcO